METQIRNPLDVLDMLAAEPGKNEKRRLMQEHDSPELRKLLILATSPFINFGVQKLPQVEPAKNSQIDLPYFFDMADKLARRELTGNAAKHFLEATWRLCDAQQQLHFGGVITKKLRCGVDTAVNDVWPGSIPVFTPALAEDWHKTAAKKNAEKHCSFPKLVSVKLDGMRAIALHDGESWGLFSREGRPIVGMPHVIAQLEAYANPTKVYDGELYSHDVVTQKGFPFLIGLLKRQSWELDDYRGKERTKVETLLSWRDRVEYHIFDAVSKSQWDRQQVTPNQYDRLVSLKVEVEDMQKAGATALQYVKHMVARSLEEATEINKQFLLEGFEGSMLKCPKQPYKFGRGTQWLKLKMFLDGEYEIIGSYMGEGKWAGSLGGFFMKTPEGKEFKCGGGRISMEERDELWASRDQHLGKMATIRYFELTPDGIPRFPIFHYFREGSE